MAADQGPRPPRGGGAIVLQGGSLGCGMRMTGVRRRPDAGAVGGAAPAPHGRTSRPVGAAIAWLILLLAAAAFAGVLLGTVPLPPLAVLATLLGRRGPRATPLVRDIVLELRLPRVALGALVGGGLAESGAVLQGLFRNPLADPALLGISSGAGFAVVLATTLHLGTGSLWALPAFGFAGGLLATAAVVFLGSTHGRTPVLTLVLAGVAVSALFGAGITLLLTLQPLTQVQTAFAWLYGGLDGASWAGVVVLLPFVLGGGLVAAAFSRELNLLATDEDGAFTLGVAVERSRRVLLLVVALITGACVALSGPVAFVGLIVPHILRRVVGADHRGLLPVSLLGGATLVVLADLAGRTLDAPAEINLGVVTAFVGVPFFLYLLRRETGQRGG